jgi:hypothetical protein
MSLITRIGASNANSYVKLGQAETILGTLFSDLSEWAALTTGQKEQRLILAAEIMEYMPLRGKRVYKDQVMAFPRRLLRPVSNSGLSHLHGLRNVDSSRLVYSYPDDQWQDEVDCRKIPEEVKEVQCQIAFAVAHPMLKTDDGFMVGPNQGVTTVTSVSIGGNSVGVAVSDPKLGNIFDAVWRSTQASIFIRLRRWLSQFRGGVVPAVIDQNYPEDNEVLPTTTTTTTTSTTTTTTTAP